MIHWRRIALAEPSHPLGDRSGPLAAARLRIFVSFVSFRSKTSAALRFRVARLGVWLGVALACGCASPTGLGPAPSIQSAANADQASIKRAQATISHIYPPSYRATQRAIITLRRKQFTCDAVLTTTPGDGLHLAIVSSLGVVTDLRVLPDGSCALQKVTPLLRESWSREFVARDLRMLFLMPTNLELGGRLNDRRIVLQAPVAANGEVARYLFSPSGEQWEGVELLRDGRCLYRAAVRRYQAFAGHPQPVPCEFEVQAGLYQLHLRMTQLAAPHAPAPHAQTTESHGITRKPTRCTHFAHHLLDEAPSTRSSFCSVSFLSCGISVACGDFVIVIVILLVIALASAAAPPRRPIPSAAGWRQENRLRNAQGSDFGFGLRIYFGFRPSNFGFPAGPACAFPWFDCLSQGKP